MDARRECRQVLRIRVRNPQGSQHRSFGMMEDHDLVRAVSFGAARTGSGRVVLDPGRPGGDLTMNSRRGGRRAVPEGRHCKQRLGKGPARPQCAATPLNARQTGIKRRGTCTGF